MKIFLIDDDTFALNFLTRKLLRAGQADLSSFTNAHVALAAITDATTAIDLVFCDLQMPDMDGVEFVRHLVALGYGGCLAIVSGEDGRILRTVEKLAAAHGLRIVGALSKPASTVELAAVLERAAARPAPNGGPAQEAYPVDELRDALARGELINHYQPKIDLASGKVVGVEALVRWLHPREGLVFPDRFVSTAEQHGLIRELTATILVSALRQARRWHDEGLLLHMAVNVSMDDLVVLDFPDFVLSQAISARVPLTSLVLEVTESRLMADPVVPLDILTRLRLKRVGLSIDDFGTGHSSLAQLRDIPFDELKVDRGFIHGANRDPSLRAIVEGSVGMAREMGMRTVAEGVEDADDWDFVHDVGFDVAQGYFIAKPMPAAQLRAFIANWDERFRNLPRVRTNTSRPLNKGNGPAEYGPHIKERLASVSASLGFV